MRMRRGRFPIGLRSETLTGTVVLLSYNFAGGEKPACLAACDADGDGEVVGVVTGAIYILTYNFAGGTPPAAPFPACGDGTLASDATIGCEDPPAKCR